MDPAGNFCVSSIEAADDSQLYVDIVTGDANLSRWPDPASGAYNITCWNATTYSDPSLDPNVEIMRATALSTRRLTVTRAQESTSAATHNASGCTHKIALCPTAKLITDLNSAAIDVGSVYGWITEYGAVGDGTTDDHEAFEDAVAALTHIVIPSGTWRIGDDVTIPATVTLEVRQGGIMTVDSGVTLTINGPVIAGNYQISGGVGTTTYAARNGLAYDRWNGTSSDELQLPSGIAFRTADMYLGGKRHYYGTAAPASGTWAVGDIVYNTAPAVTEFAGWICTVAGTPGTWNGFGSLDKVVESAAIAMDGEGAVACTIAHGLSYTPVATQITLTPYVTNGATGCCRQMIIESIDGTNITVYVFRTAAAAAGATLKVVARIHAV